MRSRRFSMPATRLGSHHSLALASQMPPAALRTECKERSWGFGFDAHDLDRTRPDRRSLDKQFDGGMAELPLGIGSVAHANERIAILLGERDGAAIGRRERFHYTMVCTLRLHWLEKSRGT